MPPLDTQDQPIRAATLTGRAHPVHPSPSQDGLALEIMSPREIGWWGQRFGIDTPYLMVPLGWGEWEPLTGMDVADVMVDGSPPTARTLFGVPQLHAALEQAATEPFTLVQSTPSTTWTLQHNLGRFPAAVAIWDTTGMLHSAVVEHSDLNTAVVTFNTPLAGTAVVI